MTTQPLDDNAIASALASLDGWERQGDKIARTYRLDHYLAGVALASAIGTIAEGFDHHPDLHIGYKRVTVELTTHDAGNRISHKDISVARAINALGYPRQG